MPLATFCSFPSPISPLALSAHLRCQEAPTYWWEVKFPKPHLISNATQISYIDYTHLTLLGNQLSLWSYMAESLRTGTTSPTVSNSQEWFLFTDGWTECAANFALGQHAREKHGKWKSERLYTNVSMSNHPPKAALAKHDVLNSRWWVYNDLKATEKNKKFKMKKIKQNAY